MAAEEDSEECTSKLLSTITQTTSSGGAKVPDGVPPHGGLRAASDTASGLSGSAHQAPPESPVSGGMDGVRQCRRGTACDPGTSRQVFPGFGPPRPGPRRGLHAEHGLRTLHSLPRLRIRKARLSVSSRTQSLSSPVSPVQRPAASLRTLTEGSCSVFCRIIAEPKAPSSLPLARRLVVTRLHTPHAVRSTRPHRHDAHECGHQQTRRPNTTSQRLSTHVAALPQHSPLACPPHHLARFTARTA